MIILKNKTKVTWSMCAGHGGCCMIGSSLLEYTPHQYACRIGSSWSRTSRQRGGGERPLWRACCHQGSHPLSCSQSQEYLPLKKICLKKCLILYIAFSWCILRGGGTFIEGGISCSTPRALAFIKAWISSVYYFQFQWRMLFPHYKRH